MVPGEGGGGLWEGGGLPWEGGGGSLEKGKSLYSTRM